MKPVFQDRFGYGSGSCAWACLASIFELPLSQFERCMPPHDGDIKKWTECALPHLECHHVDIGRNYRIIASPYVSPKWAYDAVTDWTPPTEDYWLGTVYSNALRVPPESSYWPSPGLHAVVMRGEQFVHDPNPAYQGMPLPPMVGQMWWTTKEAPGRDRTVPGAS